MAYDLAWYQERRIVYGTFLGVLTLEDLGAWSKEMTAFLDEGERPVHLLLDATHAGKIPTNAAAIQKYVTYMFHPHLAWNIVIGGSATVNMVLQGVTCRSTARFATAATLMEAVAILARSDRSLADQLLHSPD
jgi:hypothetical protein